MSGEPRQAHLDGFRGRLQTPSCRRDEASPCRLTARVRQRSIPVSRGGAVGARLGWSCALCLRLQQGGTGWALQVGRASENGRYVGCPPRHRAPAGPVVFATLMGATCVFDSESDDVDNAGFEQGIRIGNALRGWVKYFILDQGGDPRTGTGSGPEFGTVDTFGSVFGGEPRPRVLRTYVSPRDWAAFSPRVMRQARCRPVARSGHSPCCRNSERTGPSF